MTFSISRLLDDYNPLGVATLQDDPEAVFRGAATPRIGLWTLWAEAESHLRKDDWSRGLHWLKACSALEERNRVPVSQVWQAEYLSSLGITLLKIGEPGQSISALMDALQLWRDLFERLGISPEEQETPLILEVAEMYEVLTRNEESEVEPTAEQLMVSWISDCLVRRRHAVAWNLIPLLGQAGMFDQARQVAKDTLDWLPLCVTPTSLPWLQYEIEMALGNLEVSSGDLEASIREFDHAASLFSESPSHDAVERRCRALFNKANSLLRNGQPNEARSIYRKLLAYFEQLGDHEGARRVRYAELLCEWKEDKTAHIEPRLRELIREYEDYVVSQRDPENFHIYKENLEQAYRLLLSVIAFAPAKYPNALETCLKIINALREPQYLAKLDGTQPIEGMEAFSVKIESPLALLQERLAHMPKTGLLIFESGVESIVVIALCSTEDRPQVQTSIKIAEAELAEASEKLLRLMHEQSEQLIARSIAVRSVASPELVQAGHSLWNGIPVEVRHLTKECSTLFFSPTASGNIDELPLELAHTEDGWLGLSHQIARAPSLLSLVNSIAPNHIPHVLEDRACILRAEDPQELDELSSADKDASNMQRAADILGLQASLETEPTPEKALAALDDGYRLFHYVGHGMANELGESLYVSAEQGLNLSALDQLAGHKTPLVYLSCCLVGQARHLQGGKQKGFGVALLEHGAPAVVAAAYAVPDHVCGDIALAFYRAAARFSAGEAFRRARKQLHQAGYNPVCWASFSLQGDPHCSVSPKAEGSLEGSSHFTVDWAAHLMRYLASRSEIDLNACLVDLGMKRQTADVENATLLEGVERWLRSTFKGQAAVTEDEREDLVQRIADASLSAGAALRMLLAFERIEGQTQLLREIGVGLTLAIRLRDCFAFCAFAAAHAEHLTLKVQVSESTAILQTATRYLKGLVAYHSRFAGLTQRIDPVLEQLSSTMILDFSRFRDFDQVEEGLSHSRETLATQPKMPWMYWLLRYIGSNSREAFYDLAAWVNEALSEALEADNSDTAELKALANLVGSYQGRGAASPQAFAELRQYVSGREESILAIDVFELHDRVASNPNSFSDEDMYKGLQLAHKLDHRGLYSYFLLLKAQRTYEAGDFSLARELNLDVVQILRELCSKDPVYREQLQKAQVNGAISAALDGDFTTARALAAEVQGGEFEKSLGPLREVLLEQPTFGDDLEKVSEQAGDYLESGDLDLVRALEWYSEAERIAIARNNEAELCNLLGDKAVAFRHLGNMRRAIETYRQVIDLSRARDDWLNLSRWSQNLGGIWLERGDLAAAETCFNEGMQAALKSGSSEQISFATANNSILLTAKTRSGGS